MEDNTKYVDVFGIGKDACIVTYEGLTDTFTFSLNHEYFTRIQNRNVVNIGERLKSLNKFSKEEIDYIRQRMLVFKEKICNKLQDLSN